MAGIDIRTTKANLRFSLRRLICLRCDIVISLISVSITTLCTTLKRFAIGKTYKIRLFYGVVIIYRVAYNNPIVTLIIKDGKQCLKNT